MYFLQISEEATLDFKEALKWYKKRSGNLSQRLKEEVYQVLDFIRGNPHLFQKKYKNAHICYCKSFPYALHYLLEGYTIKVIAVFHTSRDPKNWDKRLENNE